MQETGRSPDKEEISLPLRVQGTIDDRKLLTELVEHHYGAKVVALQPLASDTGKHIYRVERTNGPPLVLRAYAAISDDAPSQALAMTLLFLKEQLYPAERIVCSVDNERIVMTSDGQQLLMTTFIDGVATDYSPATVHMQRKGQWSS